MTTKSRPPPKDPISRILFRAPRTPDTRSTAPAQATPLGTMSSLSSSMASFKIRQLVQNNPVPKRVMTAQKADLNPRSPLNRLCVRQKERGRVQMAEQGLRGGIATSSPLAALVRRAKRRTADCDSQEDMPHPVDDADEKSAETTEQETTFAAAKSVSDDENEDANSHQDAEPPSAPVEPLMPSAPCPPSLSSPTSPREPRTSPRLNRKRSLTVTTPPSHARKKRRMSEVLRLQKALESAPWTDSRAVQRQTRVLRVSEKRRSLIPTVVTYHPISAKLNRLKKNANAAVKRTPVKQGKNRGANVALKESPKTNRKRKANVAKSEQSANMDQSKNVVVGLKVPEQVLDRVITRSRGKNISNQSRTVSKRERVSLEIEHHRKRLRTNANPKHFTVLKENSGRQSVLAELKSTEKKTKTTPRNSRRASRAGKTGKLVPVVTPKTRAILNEDSITEDIDLDYELERVKYSKSKLERMAAAWSVTTRLYTFAFDQVLCKEMNDYIRSEFGLGESANVDVLLRAREKQEMDNDGSKIECEWHDGHENIDETLDLSFTNPDSQVTMSDMVEPVHKDVMSSMVVENGNSPIHFVRERGS